ncbi:amidase [Microbacterium nymphoidis]|uniref:amidase n=1 Tax=Microbacterium nymphoidis TaxID=2898586 RepID=UPI001E3F5C9A|nr:amidase [Microbacterium nymphoidis]MCD2499839.1 amidase [Microbacterium nymphoidis]
MTRIHDLTVGELTAEIATGALSPTEVVGHYLERIDRLGTQVGAFTEVTADAALRRAAGDLPRGPLYGVPFGDKDLVARAGVPTRYGSRAFSDHIPVTSDPLAEALDAAGGISLGKTTTPEFGLTGFTEPRVGPAARNPWDLATGAGGSSGGAAAAVSAGLLPWAPASDGGGSIRIPSATCAVVGLKPSRGRLPIGAGLDSYDALAVNGPITRTVGDAALLLDVLAAIAPSHRSVVAPGTGPFADAARAEITGLRLGMTLTTPWDHAMHIVLDPHARAAYDHAATVLAAAGADVESADWQPTGYPELFGTLWRASAATLPLDEDALARVEPITAWLVREGRDLDARRLVSAYAAARLFERRTIETFARYDAVLTPALALDPRPLGWYRTEDAERTFAQQVEYAPHTSWVNVAGLPAITVPVLAGPSGRPWSVQLVGRPGGERAILALAGRLEAERGALPRPPGFE